MNIKEVIEKCIDGDYVIDNDKHWLWIVDGGELICKSRYITNFYTLKGLFSLDFKKVHMEE